MRTILFLAAAAALVVAAPADSEACSQAPCRPGFFTPGNGATVPANLPAIHWRPTLGFDNTNIDPSKVVLARASAPSASLPFTATRRSDGSYVLVPQQPLMAGTAYVLTDQTTCAGTTVGPTATFQVVAAAPLPTELGALAETASTAGLLQVASAGGACSAEVDAHQVGIELQLGAGVMSWRDVLHFETLVDGAVWSASRSAPEEVPPGASWRGRGVDLLYRACKTEDESVSEGLAEGSHEVVMRATLPGSTTVVQSSPLTVEIDCAHEWPDKHEDGGCDAGGGGGSGWVWLGSIAAIIGVRRRSARARSRR
jgi:uncharacterized protein (TIGR03382 family)